MRLGDCDATETNFLRELASNSCTINLTCHALRVIRINHEINCKLCYMILVLRFSRGFLSDIYTEQILGYFKRGNEISPSTSHHNVLALASRLLEYTLRFLNHP
jgi:hypothetical protein